MKMYILRVSHWIQAVNVFLYFFQVVRRKAANCEQQDCCCSGIYVALCPFVECVSEYGMCKNSEFFDEVVRYNIDKLLEYIESHRGSGKLSTKE